MTYYYDPFCLTFFDFLWSTSDQLKELKHELEEAEYDYDAANGQEIDLYDQECRDYEISMSLYALWVF